MHPMQVFDQLTRLGLLKAQLAVDGADEQVRNCWVAEKRVICLSHQR